MRTKRRFPNKMLEGMRRYYANRDRQRDVPWDKQADLKNISAACKEFGYKFQASVGTFFIITPLRMWEIDESTLPFGKLIAKRNTTGDKFEPIVDSVEYLITTAIGLGGALVGHG